MKIKVFLFHRISPEKDPLWEPIPPAKFDTIIAQIKKGHTIISLEELLLANASDKQTSKPYAAITFDDGYKDFLEYALPVLKKHKVPASMYVITDCVTDQIPPWTYTLDYHFSKSKKKIIQFDSDLLGEGFRVTEFKDQDSKLAFAQKFKLKLKYLSNADRLSLYNQIIASLDDVKAPSGLMMNWNDLKLIKSEQIEIGSHSMSHPLLAQLKSEKEMILEIKNSGLAIEKELGHFPKTISYPNGSYNETVKKIAKESGYQLGLAVNQQFYDDNKNNLFEIPRVELYNQSRLKTSLRISGLTSQILKWMSQ